MLSSAVAAPSQAGCVSPAGGVRLPARRACAAPARLAARSSKLACRAQQQDEKLPLWKSASQKIATAGAAAILACSSISPYALANEFDILGEPAPTSEYVIDDANVMSKSGKKALNNLLKTSEIKSGYRITAITTRKLEFESDAFAFADKVLEGWYPTAEIGDKKGIYLIITTAKDGAVTGGPSFMKAVGDDLVDSIIGDNIPILTEEALYNEAMISVGKRLDAVLSGEADPGPPARKDTSRKRTYKTKAETDKAKNVTSTVVISLLVIAFVVPMLQFYGYVSKD